MRHILAVIGMVLLSAGAAYPEAGVKKKTPPPYEYGSVTINNFSATSGLTPVIFDHWSHRGKYTCRLCHVDIGFAMEAGATGIKASDNMKNFYCGTCHNGKTLYGNQKIFQACAADFTKEDRKRCERCHINGKSPVKEQTFAKFSEKLPRERFGNGINWEKAEEAGLIKPLDYIEGVSIKRASLANPKDFSLKSQIEGIPDIVFSHKKHMVWNGCEVCHPDIFLGVKKGSTKYSMIDLFQGKYCGACHDKVAFPQTDCQRCHTKL